MKKIILIGIFISFISSYSFSQERDFETFENIIENIANSAEEEELDYTTLYEDLYAFSIDPLNLNQATRDDLMKLHFLNDIQISNLLNYIIYNGQMLTIYELQAIEGFTANDIEMLLPFVSISNDTKEDFQVKKALKYGRNQLFLRSQWVVEDQKGFTPIADSLTENENARYLGNKYKQYLRYHFKYKNNLQWGITAEKDPGEEFFRGEQKNGFDYYSAYFLLQNHKNIKSLAIGDYHLQFGQGLALWSGMSMNKSPYTLNVIKKARGVKKYSSTDENQFFRGAATTIKLKDFELTAFYSNKNIDANITQLDTLANEVLEISSLQTMGYHRTPNELADKHAINEQVAGGHLAYAYKNLNIGATFSYSKFDAPLYKADKAYNFYSFSGTENYNTAIDYQFIWHHIHFFGEAAMSQNSGTAFVNGAIFSPVPQVAFAVLQRTIQKNYQALYANAFTENSQITNEKGLYLGTEIYPAAKWKVSAFFDTYSFPWLRYRVNAPSSGVDYFVQTDFSPSRSVSMYWKFKQETKSENITSEDSDIRPITDVKKTTMRYHISYPALPQVFFKNRIEYANYQKDNLNEHGYLLYHDVNYRPENFPLSFSFRYAVFDTDSYNARLYAYENDVLYAFSVPAYYYKGTRYYLTLKYEALNNLVFWFRYSQNNYTNVETISSGLNEIEGNKRSEIKIQMRLTF